MACRRALKPRGTHVLIGHDQFGNAAGCVFGSVPRVLAYFALSPFLGQLKKPDPEAEAPSIGHAMQVLQEMLRAGSLTPVIDRTYPLAEVPHAMRYLQEGRARGRIAVTA